MIRGRPQEDRKLVHRFLINESSLPLQAKPCLDRLRTQFTQLEGRGGGGGAAPHALPANFVPRKIALWWE